MLRFKHDVLLGEDGDDSRMKPPPAHAEGEPSWPINVDKAEWGRSRTQLGP